VACNDNTMLDMCVKCGVLEVRVLGMVSSVVSVHNYALQ
jgi:hypothetical protein